MAQKGVTTTGEIGSSELLSPGRSARPFPRSLAWTTAPIETGMNATVVDCLRWASTRNDVAVNPAGRPVDDHGGKLCPASCAVTSAA